MHQAVLKLFDLTDKVALITGGARGLGFDAASILAAAGANLILTSRSKDQARQAAEKLEKEYGVAILPLELDQANYASISCLAEKARAWKNQIDILVNNAGGGSGSGPGRLFQRSAEDMAALINVNLTGVLYCCKEIGKFMADQRRGKIINIASVAGIVGRDRRMYDRNQMTGQPIDYAAAKAGVIGMTKDLAAFLGPLGICVNCISPGGFKRNLPEGFVHDYSDRTPLGRMGRDGIDLKGAILFLASSASDYITGHNLVVDGGFSIWQ